MQSDLNVHFELQHLSPVNILQTSPERRGRKPGENRNKEEAYLRTKSLSFFVPSSIRGWGMRVAYFAVLLCQGLGPPACFFFPDSAHPKWREHRDDSVYIRTLVAAAVACYHLALNTNQPVVVVMRVVLFSVLSETLLPLLHTW